MKSLMIAVALAFAFMTNIYSQNDTGNVPAAWLTTAEKTDYAKTSTYDEAVAYSKRLAAASNGLIVYKSYGKSGERRDMPLLNAACQSLINVGFVSGGKNKTTS